MTEPHIDHAPDGGGFTPPPDTKVWDPIVRLFHWALAISFAVAWISAEDWDRVHELAGYTIAWLVAVRVIWGVIGTKHARFSDFIYAPSTILAFLRDSLRLRAKRYLGHNPAGGAMTVALLACLTAATVTGIMMTTNTFWGVDWVEEVHELTVNLVLGLVCLHVGGVVLASIEHRENLLKAMVTGWKKTVSNR